MRKKILAFITAAMLLVTMLPAAVLAADAQIDKDAFDIFFEAENFDSDGKLGQDFQGAVITAESTKPERFGVTGLSGGKYMRFRSGAVKPMYATIRFLAPEDGLYEFVIYGAPSNVGYRYGSQYKYKINNGAFVPVASGSANAADDTAVQSEYGGGADYKKNTLKEYVKLQKGENTLIIQADEPFDSTGVISVNLDCFGFTRKGDIPAATEAFPSGIAIDGAALVPSFSAAQKDYTAVVPGSAETITVNVTPEDPRYTVEVTSNGTAAEAGSVPLKFGGNTIEVTVSDPEGLPSNTYTITVTRPEATLRMLQINGTDVKGFAEQQFEYAMDVTSADFGGDVLTITANKMNAADAVEITCDGAAAADGKVTLAEGENVINVVIRAAGAENTYTLTINYSDVIRIEAEAAAEKMNGPDYVGSYAMIDPAINGVAEYATNKTFAGVTKRDAVKEGGYRFVYKFNITEEAVYSFAAVTGPYENQWYSPYSIKIDDGDYSLVNADLIREDRVVGGDLHKYYYDMDEVLAPGEHTLTLMWDTPTKADSSAYTMWMDYVEISRTDTPVDSEARLRTVKLNGKNISGFAAHKFDYTLNATSVDFGGNTITVTADQVNAADTVEITQNGAVCADGVVTLANGINTIQVTVQGAATGKQNIYTIKIDFSELLRIEAEDAAQMLNGTEYIGNYDMLKNAAATNGTYLGSTKFVHPNPGGYQLVYNFNIAEAGNYAFAAVTGPLGNKHFSPYSIKIDDGPYIAIDESMVRDSEVIINAALVRYDYQMIETLEAGEHTLTVMWDTPSEADGTGSTYAMWIDYVEISKTNLVPMPYVYPKKDQKPDMRILSDDAAYTGETVTIDKDSDTYWQLLRSTALRQIHADAAEEASVTFIVNAKEAGDYIFRAATSAFDSEFYSPYEITVNGAPVSVTYGALQEQKALLGLGADLTQYRYADIALNAGENTITFTPNGVNYEGRKVFHVDYIELTNVNSENRETIILPKLALYDEIGRPLDGTVHAGGRFRVGSKLINMAQQKQALQVIAAIYNGGVLVDTAMEDVSIGRDAEELDYMSEKIFTAPDTLDNFEIKLFAWNSAGDMVPLAEAARISNINTANTITNDYSDTMPGDEIKQYNDKDAVIDISGGKRQPTVSSAYNAYKESDMIKQAFATDVAADEYATYTYTVNVPEAGEYEFYSVANYYAGDTWVSPYTITVNGEQLTLNGSTAQELDKLSRNNEFIKYKFPNLQLHAGDNTIQFRAVPNSSNWLSFRMDYIQLLKTEPATPTNFRINTMEIENATGQPLKTISGTPYYMGEPIVRGSARLENHTAEAQTKALVLTYSEQGVEKQRAEIEVMVAPGEQVTVKTPFLRTERNENLLISECEVQLDVLEGLKLPTPIKRVTAKGLFDFMQTQVPYYNSTIAYTESVTMMTDQEGNLPQAKLMYEPIEILSVRNATQDVEYIEGYDYYWDSDAQRLVLTAHSRAKYLTYEDVFVNLDQNDAPKTGGGYIYYNEQMWRDQLLVTYTHKANVISGWGQASPLSSELPKTKAKLAAGEPVKIVAIGDSISAGSNSGANEGGYLDSFARLLQNSYTSDITMVNLSRGGMTSDWGLEQAPAAALYQPDLAIIAFCTNDAYGSGMSVEHYMNNINGMMSAIKAKNPDVEFIVAASYIPHPELSDTNHTRLVEFKDALQALETGRDDIAMVDMQLVSKKMLEYKDYIDFSGSNRNHPNGYFHRWYAQMFGSLLIK